MPRSRARRASSSNSMILAIRGNTLRWVSTLTSRLLTGNQNRAPAATRAGSARSPVRTARGTGSDGPWTAHGCLGCPVATPPGDDQPIVVVGAGVAGLGTALALLAGRAPGHPDRARRHPAAGRSRRRLRVGPAGRAPGPPLPRPAGPPAQPAARPLPRRPRRPAGRRRHRDALRRRPARRDHRPRAPARRRRPGGPGLPADHLRVGAAPHRAGHRRGDAAPRRGGRRAGGRAEASGDRRRPAHGPASPGCGCGPAERPGRRRPTRCSTPPMVVAALGRRSAVPALARRARRGPPTSTIEDTGLVYLSRFYRLHDGADPPPTDGPIGGDLGLPQVRRVPGRQPHAARSPSPSTPTTASCGPGSSTPTRSTGPPRTLLVTRPWVDPALTEAITGVHTMGGLINRRVDYLDDDGRPLVLGLPRRGRRPHLHEPALRPGLLAGHGAGHAAGRRPGRPPRDRPADARGAGDRLRGRRVEREILPWYRAAVNQDRLNRQAGGRPRPATPGRTADEPTPARRPRRSPSRRRGTASPTTPSSEAPSAHGLHAVAHAGRADAGRAHRRHRVPGLRARRSTCSTRPS